MRWGAAAAAILAALAAARSGISYSTGIVGVTKKPNHIFAEPGCFCHGDAPSPSVRAWISGPETLAAGAVGTYTMHVAKDSSVAAGFNVAALLGSLGVAESSATQRMEPLPGESAEITHTMPRAAQGRDTVTWTFLYHAPWTAGLVDTLFANGNSVNLSTDPDGDHWAFCPNFPVRIVPPSDVREAPAVAEFRLHGNYPNPFNPSTTIRYDLASAGEVDLRVYDMAGREIAVLASGWRQAGSHTVQFDVSAERPGLSSGVYLYALRARSGTGRNEERITARTMVLLK